MENPCGYGRVLLDDNFRISAIIEEADASDAQKQIKLINTGIYCIAKPFLLTALPKVRADNAQGEIYLTDIMAIGYQDTTAPVNDLVSDRLPLEDFATFVTN